MTKLKQYSLSGASDLQTWNSSDWHNSSVIWDNAGQKWRPYKSGAGVGGISQDTADGRYITSGVVLNAISSQNLSGQISAIHSARDINSWDPIAWHNSSLAWNNDISKWVAKASGGAGGASTLDDLTDVTITTPLSGQILQYNQDSAQWVNRLPPLTFNVANVVLYSGQNLNLARFKCPTGEKAYVWQCAAANSGGASISGLQIEILSGNTQLGTWASIYKTSSAIVKKGYPLAVSPIDSDIEIRFIYSGLHEYGRQATRLEYGTTFCQVSVY